VFPGIAIAEEWQRRGGEVVFVGTEAGQEKILVPRHQFRLRTLEVSRLKGVSVFQKLKTILSLPVAFGKAGRILRDERPDVVVGIGGYVSGPTCLMARLLGYPTAITDRDIPAGLTNRILGKFAHTVFTTFEQSRTFFPAQKVVCAGNAVRTQIQTQDYAVAGQQFCLFVFGGSLGAVPLNEMVMAAIEQNKALWPRLKIYHQAGKTDEEKLKTFYRERHIEAIVERFFQDMNTPFQQAHLVVCRSGAGTLSELTMSGRPAVLVPYPFAADDHQRHNALVFVDAGAAWMLPQAPGSGEALGQLLASVVAQPNTLVERAKKMTTLAKPRAAQDIVDYLWKMGVERSKFKIQNSKFKTNSEL
jgi:UDP-N-acetylglucosamine--N-acetylmuramyl-(pentapeptide) pyrophosphoryl-undecaprenol N-acetylglucosamine transferase